MDGAIAPVSSRLINPSAYHLRTEIARSASRPAAPNDQSADSVSMP